MFVHCQDHGAIKATPSILQILLHKCKLWVILWNMGRHFQSNKAKSHLMFSFFRWSYGHLGNDPFNICSQLTLPIYPSLDRLFLSIYWEPLMCSSCPSNGISHLQPPTWSSCQVASVSFLSPTCQLPPDWSCPVLGSCSQLKILFPSCLSYNI